MDASSVAPARRVAPAVVADPGGAWMPDAAPWMEPSSESPRAEGAQAANEPVVASAASAHLSASSSSSSSALSSPALSPALSSALFSASPAQSPSSPSSSSSSSSSSASSSSASSSSASSSSASSSSASSSSASSSSASSPASSSAPPPLLLPPSARHPRPSPLSPLVEIQLHGIFAPMFADAVERPPAADADADADAASGPSTLPASAPTAAHLHPAAAHVPFSPLATRSAADPPTTAAVPASLPTPTPTPPLPSPSPSSPPLPPPGPSLSPDLLAGASWAPAASAGERGKEREVDLGAQSSLRQGASSPEALLSPLMAPLTRASHSFSSNDVLPPSLSPSAAAAGAAAALPTPIAQVAVGAGREREGGVGRHKVEAVPGGVGMEEVARFGAVKRGEQGEKDEATERDVPDVRKGQEKANEVVREVKKPVDSKAALNVGLGRDSAHNERFEDRMDIDATAPNEDKKRRHDLQSVETPKGGERRSVACLSENIQGSLAELPLRNVAVYVKNFLDNDPPSAEDRAVLNAMEDILGSERARRRTDAYAIARPELAILVITDSSRRAAIWNRTVRNHSTMTSQTHNIRQRSPPRSRKDRDDGDSDNSVITKLANKNVVITLDVSALEDCERYPQYLRCVVLIVVDMAGCKLRSDEPCFGDRDHACAILVRDYYRSLPEQHRPRILAVTSRALMKGQVPPIEHNLMAKFLSKDIDRGVRWVSCYGRGSRPPEAGMMDVEHINYVAQSTMVAENSMTPAERRKSSSKAKRDRSSMSEKEFLAEQLGDAGLIFLQRVHRRRCLLRTSARARRSNSHDKDVNSNFRVRDDTYLRSLSQKALHLCNELQLAYAASTRMSKLMAVIYAGRPAVACALRELIAALPVFEGLRVEVAIGTAAASTFESYTIEDDGVSNAWQGEDTDDEVVSGFAAGEINVLILASPFCTSGKKNRPIPPCPLVIRFDDSVPDPEIDGGGGRCRVILFREATKRKSVRTAGTERRARTESQPLDMQVSDGHNERIPNSLELPARHDKVQRSPSPESHTRDVDFMISEPVKQLVAGKPRSENYKPDDTGKGRAVAAEGAEEEDHTTRVYYCRPARALLGPDTTDPETSYLYSVVTFQSRNGHVSSRAERQRRNFGVEDFLIVLSARLAEDDLVVPIQNESSTVAYEAAVAGFMKLHLESTVTLSEEQIVLGRRYTAAVFCAGSHEMRSLRFGWDCLDENGIDRTEDTLSSSERPTSAAFLRRYLVLPSKRLSLQLDTKCDVDIKTETASATLSRMLEVNQKVKRYFSSEIRPTKTERSNEPRQVDWASVRSFLELWDSAKVGEAVHVNNGLKPGQYEQLEGKFVMCGMKNQPALLSGELQHNYSVLSTLTRSKKFALREDGTFCSDEDLANIINLKASKETVAMQAAASKHLKEGAVKAETDAKDPVVNEAKTTTQSPNDGVQALEKIGSANSVKRFHVRWCVESNQLVFDAQMAGRKRTNADATERQYVIFDADRNVKKKRSVWAGNVQYSYEKYYNALSNSAVRVLDQPLLSVARPRTCTYEELLVALKGTPVPEICSSLVASGANTALMPVEFCNPYPLSIGALFLPAVLFKVEQHLSMCDLRNKFDSAVGVKGSLSDLAQAVTASHVSSTANYERLELLGDSVLKLSCTIRLFTSRPHDSEGQLHKARAFRVSNDRLHRLGVSVGLQNFLRFKNETVQDWKPPGTDIGGKALKVSLKGLADVVEAVCGAYFLFGMRRHDAQNSVSSETEDSSDSEDIKEVAVVKSGSLTESDIVESLGKRNRRGKPGASKAAKKRRRMGHDAATYKPLSAANVERAYIAGYRFLEECKVFEGKEPEHKEVLLAAIHAMHPRDSPAPSEISFRAFPRDRRLSNADEPWEKKFGPLEEILGYRFKRRHLLLCALTHSSYLKVRGRSTSDFQNFQRLEFLGDAVADFCVVWYLYQKYPDLGPGELTNLKSNVVSNEAFARTTVHLNLHTYLHHGSSAYASEIDKFIRTMRDEEEEGNHNLGGVKSALGEIAAPKVLGDIFEAVLGAIYVDSGLQQAWTVCISLLSESLRISADPQMSDTHPAQELQDLVMRVWKVSISAPRYEQEPEDVKTRGKEYSVYIHSTKVATARGSTVKRAKLLAAKRALELLQDRDENSRGYKLLRALKEEGIRRKVQAQRDFN